MPGTRCRELLLTVVCKTANCMGSWLCRATEEQKVAYDGIVVQICSYVLASNGDIEQTQDQQSDEVMTDHVNLAICKKASSC